MLMNNIVENAFSYCGRALRGVEEWINTAFSEKKTQQLGRGSYNVYFKE